MDITLNVKETEEIIKSSSIPDLTILKHNYEKLERYHTSTRTRYFLNLVKQQIEEKNDDIL